MWSWTARTPQPWWCSTPSHSDCPSRIAATTGVVVALNETTSGLAFQLAPGHRPPSWPDPAVPQQVHLDVMVEDVTASGPDVLALGAVKLDGEDVYADPAGTPSASSGGRMGTADSRLTNLRG